MSGQTRGWKQETRRKKKQWRTEASQFITVLALTMVVENDWWKNFFTGVALDLWRHAVTEAQTRLEADWIERELQLPGSAKILDVPCGNGRHSLELAARGYKLTGVDIAGEFIEEARSKARERNLRAQWHERDMRSLPWREEFDGAFCFGNSFGYFDDESNLNFLRSVQHSLKPGAKFVLESGMIAESILPDFQKRESHQAGDILLIEENRFDVARSRVETEYTFVRGNEIEKRSGSHRIYTLHELCDLLATAGFSNMKPSDSLDGKPFQLGSPSLYIVATKVAPSSSPE